MELTTNNIPMRLKTTITKIIFLHEGHFSKAYYEMFGIETLENNGYKVEVWNFMPFLKSSEFQKETPPDPIIWNGYHIFKNRKEAIKAVSGLFSSSLVICGLHYNIETYIFYRIMSKNKIIYCSNLAMAIPTGTMTVKKSTGVRLQRVNISRIILRAFLAVPFRYLGIKPVDIIFAMGEKYLTCGYPSSEKSEILWVHFYDYDKYLLAMEKSPLVEHKAGIFLDEYLPFHPDNIDMKVPAVNADEYFSLLRNFFDHIENKFGVNIIIAAHPRSRYDEMPDMFGGRPVIRGKTVELIQKADFVIMHHSMSINYAVLFKKPIIFITTDQVDQYLTEDPTIEWLAAYFGKRKHNLNKEFTINLQGELLIKGEAYRKYQNDYIKKEGSEKKMLWQIVADRIKNIL
jgi:hypothetical protein